MVEAQVEDMVGFRDEMQVLMAQLLELIQKHGKTKGQLLLLEQCTGCFWDAMTELIADAEEDR